MAELYGKERGTNASLLSKIRALKGNIEVSERRVCMLLSLHRFSLSFVVVDSPVDGPVDSPVVVAAVVASVLPSLGCCCCCCCCCCCPLPLNPPPLPPRLFFLFITRSEMSV